MGKKHILNDSITQAFENYEKNKQFSPFRDVTKVEEGSMLIWYPKIKDLDIPQPKTEAYLFSEKDLKYLYDGKKFSMK